MYYAGYQGGAAEEANRQSAIGAERAGQDLYTGDTNLATAQDWAQNDQLRGTVQGNGFYNLGSDNAAIQGNTASYYGNQGTSYQVQGDQDYASQALARAKQLGYGGAAASAGAENMTAAANYGRTAASDYGDAERSRQGQQAFGALGGNYGQTQFGTSQGLLGGAARDYTSQLTARNQEVSAIDRLKNFYQQGPGPSAAQAQLAQSTNQNMANAISLARSGRGAGDNAAAMRQAMFSNAATQQEAGSQMAQLRAQEAATWRGQQLGAMGQEQSALAGLRGQDVSTMGQNLGSAAQFGGLGYQGIGLGAQQANQTRGQDISLYGANIGAQAGMAGLGYQGYGLGAQQANQARGQDLTSLAQNNQTGLGYAQLGQNFEQMGLNNQVANSQMANQQYMQGDQLAQQDRLAGMQNQINYAQLANQQQSSTDQLRAQILNAQLQSDTAKYGADRGVQVGMAQIQQQQNAAQMAMYGSLAAGAVGLLSDIRAKKNIRKPEGLLEKVFGLADHGHGEGDGSDDGDSVPQPATSPKTNPYASLPQEVPLPGSPSFEQPISPFAQQAPAPAIALPGQDPRNEQQTVPVDFTQPPPGGGPGVGMPQYGWQQPMPKSDERSKQAMYRLGQLSAGQQGGAAPSAPSAPGVDLRPAQGYSYEYKNPNSPGAAPGRHFGPMAQDLEKTPAGASVVNTGADGMKSIDTDRLSLVNTAAISEHQRRMDRLEALARGGRG